jgi:hypothetical protein
MIAIAFLLFRRRWWAPQRRHGLAAPHWLIEMVNLQDLLKASLGLALSNGAPDAARACEVSNGAASPAPPQVLLAHHLRQLKLPTFLREYEKVAAEAAREGLDHVRFLLRLAELELIDRERRMVERRIRAARFPAVKSFDTFDFAAIPSLNKPLVLELARCEYVVARDNIITLGNSGKRHKRLHPRG